MASYTQVFADAWGARVERLARDRRFVIRSTELDLLAEVWARRGTAPGGGPRPSALRPIISHHGGRGLHLFGVRGAAGAVRTRALLLLFAFDGLTVADPLVDVFALDRTAGRDRAVAALREVFQEVVELAPLFDAGAIDVTSYRPDLDDPRRSQVLRRLGLDPSLTVFRNFAEAAVPAAETPRLTDEYVQESRTLLDRFGVRPPVMDSVESAWAAVRELAAAVIEVSWQMAVTLQDPHADVALREGVEVDLFAEILASDESADAESLRTSRARTRHFPRLHAGEFPVVDGSRLSVADALSLRRDDTFERFRDGLHLALDEFEATLLRTSDPHQARAGFEQRMRAESRLVVGSARAGSFRGHVLGNLVPVALGAATAGGSALVDVSPAAVAVASAVPAAGGLLGEWCRGRTARRSRAAATRYYAVLGG